MNSKFIFKTLQQAVARESSAAYVGYTPKINHRKYGCKVPGCRNRAFARHLCNAHYLRLHYGRPMNLPILNRRRAGKCSECEAPTFKNGGWGRCKKHYARRRTKILKETLVSLFGGKCSKCKHIYPSPVFDFHHKHNKQFAIGECWSSLRIMAIEAAKCDLLCANCHRMETYNGRF